MGVLFSKASRFALSRPPAHEVKAQFIERFTRFIEWPDGALPAGGPFVVCLVGDGALADAFARVAARREIKNLPTEVRRMPARRASTLGCHLIYFARVDADDLTSLLARVQRSPVLTVADSPGFGEEGVLINLFIDQTSRVRFEINLEAVEKSRLAFSAKLLRLATRTAAER